MRSFLEFFREAVRVSFAMPSEVSPAWSLDGIYEPSAVQQLPDGRFLVVEDEKRQPFSVFTVGADGRVQSQALTPSLFQVSSSAWKLDDLEGLTMDQSGFLYAITSHSRDEDGNEKKSREKLIRFRVDGRHVVMPQVVSDLKRALTTRYPVLAAAAAVRDVKDSGGLNIEALEVDPHNGQLLIAFRSPLVDGKAIVACLENTADVFDSGAKARFPPTLEELDLGARGIRGLSYVPSLDAYLVIAGPVSKADEGFGLWLWKGAGAAARPVQIPLGVDLTRAEGTSAALINGVEHVIVVCDDGDRDSGRSATARLLDPRLFAQD